MCLTVAKVGGSLFLSRGFVARLQEWAKDYHQRNPETRVLLVTGGGPTVEGLRAIHSQNPVDELQAHWAAIELMSVNARLLQGWWPGLPQVATRTDLVTLLTTSRLAVMDTYAFMSAYSGSIPPLPASWEVTSDSIAAWITEVVEGDELVLLKSAPSPVLANDWQLAADAGYVDRYFPQAASRLGRVTWHCL